MMDYGKFLEGQMGKALQALPVKERADMNRFVQKIGNIMGDDKKTGDQKTEEVLLMEKEMQQKYADNNNK